MSTELSVHSYDWVVRDRDGDDEEAVIHSWCLDKDSKPYLLRYKTFKPFCYLELPQWIRNNKYVWTDMTADAFVKELSKILGYNAPVKHFFRPSEKTYYYRDNVLFPMIILQFQNIRAMNSCKYLLENPLQTEDWGTILCKILHAEFTLDRKLLSMKDTKYSQWFKIIGNKVPEDDKVSTLYHEYEVYWETMVSLPQKETATWFTYPGWLSWDIECYSHRHRAMPDKYNAKDCAYMVSAVFERIGTESPRVRYCIVMGHSKHIPKERLENTTVIWVSSELELVQKFCEVVRYLDPEILTGYNILSFDYPYLDHRIKRCLAEWPLIGRLKHEPSTFKTKQWESSAYGFQSINYLIMEGRISIDMHPIIKREHKLDKYTLDFVCRRFLGKTKHDVTAQQMFVAYEKNKLTLQTLISVLREIQDNPNIEKDPEYILRKDEAMKAYNESTDEMTIILEYCIQDSELVVDLVKKFNIWMVLVENSNIAGVNIFDLYTRGQQHGCMSQLYDLAYKCGRILDQRESPDYEASGGACFKPKKGLHDNTICLDFASLYPSIIMAFNICWSTLVDPEFDYLVPDEDCWIIEFDQEEPEISDKRVIVRSTCDDDDFLIDLGLKRKTKKNQKMVTKHYRFKWYKKKEGLLPRLVRQLVAERNQVRQEAKGIKDPLLKELYNVRQLALKVRANSFYGFLGIRNGGKMPLIEGAMSVTAKGRELINQVKTYIEDKYDGKMIYGDTDSCTGDTPILVRYNQKIINYIQIKDLIDLPTSTGRQEFYNVSHYDIEVWSDIGWTKINKLMRHRTNKNLYRVTTNTGIIDVTEDHSLLNSRGVEVKPTDMKIGEELLHNDLPNISYKDSMNLNTAWLYGLFMSCGRCNLSHWYIRHRNLDIINRASLILIHLGYNVATKRYNDCYILYSNFLTLLFEYYVAFYNNDNIKIVPMEILESNFYIKSTFIAGFLDGNVPAKDKISMAGIVYLLGCIGIDYKIEDGMIKTKTSKNQNSIVSISYLGKIDTDVFDLETENHHFSAGVGRMVVHNSVMMTLNIKDSSECNYWGVRLAQEISGVKKTVFDENGKHIGGDMGPDGVTPFLEDIPGLFPPPLRMEFEKAMRILCLKKKKYAALLIGKDGKFKYIPILDSDGNTIGYKDELMMLLKGIVLARRDNCKFLRELYHKILDIIMVRGTVEEAVSVLIDSIADLMKGNVPVEKLEIIRELGSSYKSDNYFMKVFAEELTKDGKIVNPGDRLNFIVSKRPGVKPLGQRLKLLEQYIDSQGSDKPIEIDYLYYVEKLLMNPINQLFKIGFKRVVDALCMFGVSYKPTNRHKNILVKYPIKIIYHFLARGHDIYAFKNFMISNIQKISNPANFSLALQIVEAKPPPKKKVKAIEPQPSPLITPPKNPILPRISMSPASSPLYKIVTPTNMGLSPLSSPLPNIAFSPCNRKT